MKGVKLLMLLIAFHVITAMIIYNTATSLRMPEITIRFNLIEYDTSGDFWAVAKNFFISIINVLYGIGTLLWSMIQILAWMITIVAQSFTFAYVPDPGLRTGLTVLSTLIFVYALITAIMEIRSGGGISV